jgi:hypothetical protein
MQIYRTSAPLMNKPIGPTPLLPSHTQSFKINYQCDSPTQIRLQATTTNHPIRSTHLTCPAAPSLYANQSHISSSNEQAYPLAYLSAFTKEYNFSQQHLSSPISTCMVLPWLVRIPVDIAAASKHGTHPDRAFQPTPISTSLTTGIFVLVFLI